MSNDPYSLSKMTEAELTRFWIIQLNIEQVPFLIWEGQRVGGRLATFDSTSDQHWRLCSELTKRLQAHAASNDPNKSFSELFSNCVDIFCVIELGIGDDRTKDAAMWWKGLWKREIVH